MPSPRRPSLTRAMIPEPDRHYIPDDVDDRDLAFWYLAFRTGREAQAASAPAAVAVPGRTRRPPPANGKVDPEVALAHQSARGPAEDDGYEDDGESTWISEMIDQAHRDLAPEAAIDAVDAALRKHPEVAKWIEADAPPSARAMGGVLAKALELNGLRKAQKDF